MTIQQALELAIRHHQSGRLAEAERIYRQILAADPRNAVALHLLGVVAHQVGRVDAAVDLIRQAIAVAPGVPDFHSNLGNALRDRNQLDQAIAAYRQAVALNRNFADAFCNLGNALKDKALQAEAIAAYRRAIALKPDLAQAHSNLGNVLCDLGQFEEAIAAHRQAITIRPDFAEAYSNLSNALCWKRRFEEAAAAGRQAIALRPDYVEAYCNLGHALKGLGRLDEAEAACRHAVALNPLNPRVAQVHGNLGNVLMDKGQLEDAVVAYRQAAGLDPDDTASSSNLLLLLNYHPQFDAQSIKAEQRQWVQRHAEPLARAIAPFDNTRVENRRLRLGYVSRDFCDHPVGRNLVPLLSRHDHDRFEVFCYADVANPDAITDRFRPHADRWINTVGLSDEQLAALIRRDQIDILVDLGLHTAHNRLLVFARKPAPVQGTFAGYPGSTGLTAIDYRISDPFLDPAGVDESIYSEQTIRLPHSFWCHDPLDCADVRVGPLPATATANGVVTFGCLNDFSKVNDGCLRLWAKVLSRFPGSRLVLLAPEGSHRQRTLKFLGAESIAADRIEFVTRKPRRAYLELFHRVDVSLDTLPYNGHTTSLESMWMGVPVITLIGQTVVGRAGVSQLSNLGLTELIAETPDRFVQIAVDLANDLPRLAKLRSTLRQRMEASPLMDAPGWTHAIETAFREMWQKWCANET